ncbi:hypothetical protein, partial [Escherichia coli]|uniref:hypothetical protein n=1 Tax=Escherichia coli TaxID=562 RepID=UPI000A7FF714
MLNQETAKAARTDSGYILRAPRRMRVADAVAQYMRVPMGAGNSVPWDPLVAPYVIVNRPGFPGECFICELRLPDHRFRWKHNKL